MHSKQRGIMERYKNLRGQRAGRGQQGTTRLNTEIKTVIVYILYIQQSNLKIQPTVQHINRAKTTCTTRAYSGQRPDWRLWGRLVWTCKAKPWHCPGASACSGPGRSKPVIGGFPPPWSLLQIRLRTTPSLILGRPMTPYLWSHYYGPPGSDRPGTSGLGSRAGTRRTENHSSSVFIFLRMKQLWLVHNVSDPIISFVEIYKLNNRTRSQQNNRSQSPCWKWSVVLLRLCSVVQSGLIRSFPSKATSCKLLAILHATTQICVKSNQI